MLRLGLVSSRRLALATSLRSSTTLLGTTNCARYLSTTEEKEQEQQEQHQKKQTPKLRRPETSKSNDDGHGRRCGRHEQRRIYQKTR